VSLLTVLLTITIDWNPRITELGPFELTWHGVFTAVGIAGGVYLGAWIARKEGFTEDDAYSIALVGVPVGIIGARAMWVIENEERLDSWVDIFRINEGGITVWGAVIGGVIGALAYGVIRRLPLRRGLDAAGFGLLLGMAIGRIGDLINGEHYAKLTDLWWGVKYTHADSPSAIPGGWPGELPANYVTEHGPYPIQHPATTYEMIGDFLIIGIMALVFMKLWRHRPGVTFFTGLVLYSAMRFGVSYLRLDSEYVIKDWMTFPQVVSTCTFAIGVLGLAWTLLRSAEKTPVTAAAQPAPASGAAAPRRA
jgi:phosphatidylglycerol:prolipoprotein diacylglycerol transferase